MLRLARVADGWTWQWLALLEASSQRRKEEAEIARVGIDAVTHSLEEWAKSSGRCAAQQ